MNWCVFISGTGSNLKALMECPSVGQVRLVVSSKASCHGLLKARRSGIPVFKTGSKIDWDSLNKVLLAKKIDYIFLAGFMKVIPAQFVAQWEGRILNIHPSYLPSYPGLNSIERAYNDKKNLGVTIHEVNEKVDDGEILIQSEVDTAQSLEFTELRVHIKEHMLARKAFKKWSHQKRF